MRRLRDRRRALLRPVGGQAPRDADGALLPAVETTIAALELGDRDAALAQLARGYARAIDEAQDEAYALRQLGPLLLKSLISLGATPASRGKLPDAGPRRVNRIRELRAAEARKRGAL